MNDPNEASMDSSAEEADSNNNIQHELTFLVTHWLANYGNPHRSNGDASSRVTATTTPDEQLQSLAIERIRRATAEIASAFASVGAYGTTLRPSFTEGESFFEHRSLPRNSTFSDVSRRHTRLPTSHLEHLAQSAAFNSAAADIGALRNVRTNLLLRATSRGESLRRNQQQSSGSSGRTLQEVIVLDGDDSPVAARGMNSFSFSCNGMSILETPALIQANSTQTNSGTNLTNTSNAIVQIPTERNCEPLPIIDIQPTQWDVAHRIAETIREFLAVREKVQTMDHEIRSIQASLTLHRLNMAELEAKYNAINQDSNLGTAERLEEVEEIKTSQQGSDRVISQLQRKLIDLNSTQGSNRIGLAELESKVREMDRTRRTFITSFRDPFASWKGPLSKDNRVGGCAILNAVLSRQRGLSRSHHSQISSKSNLLKGQRPSHFLEIRKDILVAKLSHAVTINAHQNCPVYCLRFDRTGRYFITGADDYLLKVFFLGAAQSCRTRNDADGSRRLRCNYGANHRGAVLVCSLRGHAGVINDISVSTDNCFLATASVDGDVRIWGLKNGCPVAILRGHGGGANMVSWSTLTPFRLISTGSDGFARVWDIRDACLKRYRSEVESRNEYKLQLTSEEKRIYEKCQQKDSTNSLLAQNVVDTHRVLHATESGDAQVEPPDSRPPLGPPLGAGAADDLANATGNPTESTNLSQGGARSGGIIVPPLPLAVSALGHEEDGSGPPAEDQEVGADPLDPGQFVANDLIDEGVKLLVKYQHGNAQEEQQQGPGTRSRRAAINVICVAHCPLGKQFATGSDDGICRVWEDYDDYQISLIDKRMSGRESTFGSYSPSPPTSGIECKPLLKLMGHVSTITDLAYSYAGDRILSASQKDGIVRIWTVGSSDVSARTRHDAMKEKRVNQIVIKLINPASKQAVPASRRRHGSAVRNPANTKVSCDVAVWTHDDSKIITSQCVQLKQNGNEIQPGSQFLFLWDSWSGHCLIGISGAHSMQCPVVLPHPNDSSIVCTAAADGYVKIWDWEQGKCIYTHQNKVESGPPDPNNPDKIAGFLDGAFNRNGSEIVLTDDSGQVTVLSAIADHSTQTKNGESSAWMGEQYFANDYYELAYDQNGYCIEKGSEQPPHLAPKGARCTHSGAAYSDEVNEIFRNLAGPMPLPDNIGLWNREETRIKRSKFGSEAIRSIDLSTVRIGVREYDPLSTVIVRGSDHVEQSNFSPNARKLNSSFLANADASRPASAAGNPSNRTLSANYRYLDYDDLVRREGNPEEDEQDSDDEEFQPAAPNRRNGNESEESDDDNLDNNSLYSSGSPRRRRRSQSARTEQRRVRANRRAQRRDNDFIEIGSDDDMIAQFVSSNTKPTGPYERDYLIAGHIWRLKSQPDARRVHRRWLRREESDSSYFGRKIYAPQLGDSVVYIPRAHYETIKDFPSLQPPWQTWPTGTAWPVVRCFVRGVRFRFPYEDYFRKGHSTCVSIVAILTLEVTGIPELSQDREFPWPKPSFVEPTRPFVFELSVFENSHCEYLIPESLYTSRLEALETNIRARGMVFGGLEVDLYYDAEQHGDDEEMEVWAFSLKDRIEDDDCPSSVHLQRSGYGVLQVVGDDGYEDAASPWELNTEGANLIRPCLAEDEKKYVIAALNSLLETKDIAEHLSMPVDQERYSDYATMVEVAMDMMFVKRRLAENYYSSKLGVAGDLFLIRDNCVKYNTLDNEMSETASKMCSDFLQKILSTEEQEQIVTEDTYNSLSQQQFDGRQGTTIRIRMSSTRSQAGSDTPSSSSARRYTLRDRTGAQPWSSLENWPVLEAGARSGRERRQVGSIEPMTRRNARHQISNAMETLGQELHVRGLGEGVGDSTTLFRTQRQRRNEVSIRAEVPDAASIEDAQEDFPISRRGSRRVPRGDADQENHLAPQRRNSRATSYEGTLRQNGRGRASLRSTQDIDFETNRGQQLSQTGPRLRTRSTNNSLQMRDEEKDDDDSDHSEVHDDDHGIVEDPRSTRGRRNTRSKLSSDSPASETAESDEDGEESPEPRGARSRNHSSTRSNPKRASASSRWTEELDLSVDDGSRDDYQEDSSVVESHDSDGDIDDELTEAPRKSRNRESSRTYGKSRLANGRSGVASPASPGRRSNRASTRLRASYQEVESDVDIDEMSDSDGSDEVEIPRKTAGRRIASRNATYSSDLSPEEDQDSEDEMSYTKRNGRKRGSTQKKKQKVAKKSSRREPVNKKRKFGESAKELPDIQRWPQIDIKEITNVVAAVVAKMSEYDHDNVFSVPVVEAYPEIAASYTKIIKRPMDLRMIGEESIHTYESIAKLQDDLMLMFRNCCTYNGPDSELWQYGKNLYDRINDVFLDVCTELDVELPLNWSPS